MNAPVKIETSLLGIISAGLSSVEAAKKTSANPHFKSKYADLGSVLDAIRPIAEHGLWFRQVSHERDNGVAVETLYVHEKGELSAGTVFVPADKNNAQGFGSAQTYARRYGLQLAFGLATEDDDGNAASAAPGRAREGQSKESAVSPPRPITDSELEKLELMIPAAQLTPAHFCQTFGIERVSDLPADRFQEAINRINDRMATLAKNETNAKAKESA